MTDRSHGPPRISAWIIVYRAGWIIYFEQTQELQPTGERLRDCTPFADDFALDALAGMAKVNDEAHCHLSRCMR